MRRAPYIALAGVASVLVLCGAGATALTSAEPAACQPPTSVDQGDAVEVTTVCSIPKATATVTATETLPPVTVHTTHTVTPTPTPTPTAAKKIIGMSAPANLWAQRVSEVGSCGLEARRIFADLAKGAQDKRSLIEDAIADGMMPVVSYKVGGNVTGAGQGAFDTVANQAAAFLDGYNVPMAVTIWHEPNGDMTGPQYVAMTERLLPFFKRGQLKVGPIYNGFLVDTANGTNTLRTFTSPTLWNLWDYFGYDTYDGPNRNPADRIDPMLAFVAANGKPNIPQLIGEYNGIDAAAITELGNEVLETPTFWAALLWNTDADASIGATHLSGDRLAAFQATKRDSRALHEPPC